MKKIKIVFILTLPLIVRRVYMKKNCILILTFLIIFLGFASFSVNSIVVGAVEVNEFRLDCGVPGCPGHLIGEDPCPDPGWPPPVPKKLYFNTYNGGKNDINTTKDVDNIINFFNNKDYTVINMINSNFSEMTEIEGGYSQEQIKALYHDNLHNSNSIILKNRNMDNTQILLEVKRITNDEYQENDLSSDITLENEYLIKKGNNYKHIKRLQVLYSGDYEYLKEIFWDTTNNKIVSSQEMQDYFPITNLSEKKYE